MKIFQQKILPEEYLEKIANKICKKAKFISGNYNISPKVVKSIIRHSRIPKQNIFGLNHVEQKIVLNDLKLKGVIKYVAPQIIRVRVNKDIQFNKKL